MGEDVLHIHAVVDELDESDDAQGVSSDINDPPFVLVLEVIQRREHTPHLVRRAEFALAAYSGDSDHLFWFYSITCSSQRDGSDGITVSDRIQSVCS